MVNLGKQINVTSEAFERVRRNRPDISAADELDGGCGVKDCNQPQLDTFPVCEQHAFDIWLEVGFFRMDMHKAAEAHTRKASIKRSQVDLIKEQAVFEQAKVERQQQPGTIYYLQIEDHIKIGFTTDLDVRLNAYPPMAKLRATHPGTRETEASVHQRFATDLSGRREWFRTSPKLETYISLVKEKFKQDRRVAA